MFASATHSAMHRHMTRWLSIKTFVLAVNHFIFVWGRMAGGLSIWHCYGLPYFSIFVDLARQSRMISTVRAVIY